MKRYQLPVIFALALLIRIVLIHMYPIIFGGDTVLRLANRDRIQLAYQLPVLQAAIYAVSKVSTAVLPVRYLMALIGAIAAAGFFRMTTPILGASNACWAALLLATNPFLVQLSIVPYQEVAMIAALFLAFHFFFAAKMTACSVSLGLACLTRYEAWAACPVLFAAYLLQHGANLRNMAKAALVFTWAPLMWIFYTRGISPGGTFVLEFPASLDRLVRYVYLGWITVKNTPVPVLFLALIGVNGVWKDARSRILMAFMALFLLSIPFSAHGESPNPERFVTAREATLLIAAVAFLAGSGMRAHRRMGVALASAGLLLGIYDAHRFIRRDTSAPKLQLSYRLAQYLDANVPDSEKVGILTAPIPTELVENYLNKVARRGGPDALRKAYQIMAGVDTSPPDYQRTLIHSRLGKARLLSFAGSAVPGSPMPPPTPVEWVAIWSDFRPSNALEEQLHASVLNRSPIQIIQMQPLSVSVYRAMPLPNRVP